eukprot:5922458-Amphidinium_carterae.1
MGVAINSGRHELDLWNILCLRGEGIYGTLRSDINVVWFLGWRLALMFQTECTSTVPTPIPIIFQHPIPIMSLPSDEILQHVFVIACISSRAPKAQPLQKTKIVESVKLLCFPEGLAGVRSLPGSGQARAGLRGRACQR